MSLDERYSKQLLLPQIGEKGQKRLLQSSVLVVGCGALGSSISQILVRAGIGKIIVTDRDVVELSNIHRQVLFTEDDAKTHQPKAIAAGKALQKINSTVSIEPKLIDVSSRNIKELIKGVDIVLDGTDNLETRYLVNDACVEQNIPWIYGGAVGTGGLLMTVDPGNGPCLRCIFNEPPPPGTLPTCDTAGILNTVPIIVASLQATEAIKMLLGNKSGVGKLTQMDLWRGHFSTLKVEADSDCPACHHRNFEFLSATQTAWVTSLCGRNAVQITPASDAELDLRTLAEKLSPLGEVQFNGIIVTFTTDTNELMIFPDGRAIIKGTNDEAKAKSLYSRFIGI